ncbi:hypothetical protein [Azospirillum rugosum]|uniref:Uncharacterized protein n=1 Tax=Azospirillum rugosum TaxID=416170 RepID=A0ABS4SEK4_9PROT|nr:hypothetical protein [Azospirillum rugosum]MBP2291016.1 hypothetical protein [Azospirillum rugosum]MDQ0524920.1 hypothetical protein [Azospirillum rugosum]
MTDIPITVIPPGAFGDEALLSAFGRWLPLTINAVEHGYDPSPEENEVSKESVSFYIDTPALSPVGVIMKMAAFMYWADDVGGFTEDHEHPLYKFKLSLPKEAERVGGPLARDAVGFGLRMIEQYMLRAEKRDSDQSGEITKLRAQVNGTEIKPSLDTLWLVRCIGENWNAYNELDPCVRRREPGEPERNSVRDREYDARVDRNFVLADMLLHSGSRTVGDVALQAVVAALFMDGIVTDLEAIDNEHGGYAVAARNARAIWRMLEAAAPVLAATAGINPREMGLGSYLRIDEFPVPTKPEQPTDIHIPTGLTDADMETLSLVRSMSPEGRASFLAVGKALLALSEAEKTGVGIDEAIDALEAANPLSEPMRAYVAELRAKRANVKTGGAA